MQNEMTQISKELFFKDTKIIVSYCLTKKIFWFSKFHILLQKLPENP